MTTLEPLFHPKSIAVIGASAGVSATGAPKMGAAALNHLVDHGFPGAVHPVNPRHRELAGRPCYPRVGDIPGPVDLALILLPAADCVAALRDCAAKGVRAAIVFSSGFAEAGDAALQAELARVARDAGIRVCGPNTAGFVDLGANMVASISMVCAINPFRRGPVAFVTQSGALGGSMLGRGMEEGIGFSHWVATGNEADIDVAEYIDYLVDQDPVRVIALFLEGVRDGPAFLRACARAAAAGKPIVVYKTGVSEVAAAAAASHTGAMAGSDRVFDAVCRQQGLVRVDDVGDLFRVAQTFAWLEGKLPAGRRMGIVSASGGICGVAADECHRFGLDIPRLSGAAQDRIRAVVPAFAAVVNPIDVTGQIRSSATGYQDTVRIVLQQDEIDGVLLLVTMAGEPRASFYGREISRLARESGKPVVVAWTGALSVARQGYPMLRENRVPNFLTVREAVRAMAAAADYAAFRRRHGGGAP
ncbi:MAG: CoA-binding protein [Hyphomicrobiales bacterium]|nr:CoA-binding protein [Hyphomicrobiales bacterium]MCP5370299.1 CoA-binding protein [Hyphomicrobiales bacterium]